MFAENDVTTSRYPPENETANGNCRGRRCASPTSVIATKYLNDTPQAGIAVQRPLWVYPQIPENKGSGDPNLASSFACVTDEREFNETPAPQYGP